MHAGDKVRHRTRPSEPFAQPNERGVVLRATPAYRTIPAQCLVGWGEMKRPDDPICRLFETAPRAEYETWELQKELAYR